MATAGAIAIDADPVTVLNAVRFALGDNGTRTIPEFVAFSRQLATDLAAAIARAEAAEAKLAAMEQDAREIYAQIPGLPVTPETCDAVTDVLTRFCLDFNEAIAAQQAEGEDRG